jgi:recombinational DNA repair protein (RecF pathway)
MPEFNNLPCCGPTETARLKELPHAFGFDFDLHQCLGCGRTWIYAFSTAGGSGAWEWVGETTAQQLLEADGDELRTLLREWAAHFN